MRLWPQVSKKNWRRAKGNELKRTKLRSEAFVQVLQPLRVGVIRPATILSTRQLSFPSDVELLLLLECRWLKGWRIRGRGMLWNQSGLNYRSSWCVVSHRVEPNTNVGEFNLCAFVVLPQVSRTHVLETEPLEILGNMHVKICKSNIPKNIINSRLLLYLINVLHLIWKS